MKYDPFTLPLPRCACGTMIPVAAANDPAAPLEWSCSKCGLSEKAAIEKCMLGDQSAFTLLFAIHQYLLYSYVRWKLKFEDPEEAFEVVQRAMFAGWQGLQKTKLYSAHWGRRKPGQEESWEECPNRSRFRGKAQFGTWLIGIAKIVAREMRAAFQREHRLETVALGGMQPTRSATMQEPELEADYGQIQSAMEEQIIAINPAIGSLPPQQRRILRLHLAGYKHREIAVELGLAASTCRVAHRDAVRNLRKAVL